ncbi:MAG: hypothetical protein JWO53_670, partial [Chlamydiia bacterium]|nr:hypothetical protein [Chlamydiia bacterium]
EGTFDSWSIDPEYAKTKKELFECYTKGYDEAQALYQKSLHKLKGYAAVHNMKIESMLLPFQSLGKIFKEPLQSKAFMRPLEDYRTVNVPLDINLWEEEWREMRQRKIEEQIASISLTPSPVQAEEKKEEKKSPVVSASPKSSISLPFTYNAWVADWFVNPEKNLTHQKYCTSKKQQVVEAHTFAQAIDHFAKVVGIRGRYQSKNNPSKWYESYTISVEIEDMEGEKRREYITYGFHEKTGLLEHRSLTIATQEEDIAAQLEEGYDQFDWPELNAEKNKKLLKEISLKLCQKYGASDKSCLVEVSEYTLTFWDNKNQCWIQIMNPRGVDALRAMV